ncbi:MAG: response regulator [Bacteroidia bacterium]|nr:response regulator [Bacteroidia bacterium]
MSQLKIGIVEDELIIAEALRQMLVSMGYLTTEIATRYSEAVDMIESEKPDLVLLDINLAGQLDGVDLAYVIRKNFNTPIIFLTANTDPQTIQRVKQVNPSAFLAKPISKEQLFSAREIAVSNFSAATSSGTPASAAVQPEFIFIKDGGAFHKVYLNTILYLESEGNYVSVHLTDKTKILARTTLNELYDVLVKGNFFRVHRSYVINIQKIEKIGASEIIIRDVKIPLSKTYKAELLKLTHHAKGD